MKKKLIEQLFHLQSKADLIRSLSPTTVVEGDPSSEQIQIALNKLSPNLAKKYKQVKLDVLDGSRLSWEGTAHEIREIIREVLEILAPDDQVVEAKWFKKVPNTNGPTHAQRAKYILLQNSSDSKQIELVSHIVEFEEMMSKIIRSTYIRASDAAHRHKTALEIVRILRYAEAFLPDLLDI